MGVRTWGVAALVAVACTTGCDSGSADEATEDPSSSSRRPSTTSSSVTPTPSEEVTPDFVARVVDVGETPAEITEGFGSLWVVGHRSGVVSRIDPRTGKVEAQIDTGGTMLIGGAVAAGHVWFLDASSMQLRAIDAQSETVEISVPVHSDGGGVAATTDGVWFAGTNGEVVHVDGAGNVRTRVEVAERGELLIPWFADGRVFVARPDRGELVAVDPDAGEVVWSRRLGGDVGTMASSPGTLWVGRWSGELLAVDPATGKVRRTFDVPAVDDIAICDGRVWLRVSDRELVALDIESGRQVESYDELPASEIPGGGIICSADAVWMANWTDGSVWAVPQT